ncbi:integral to membrane protein [Favolaschia claudopus]|uniref:Glycerophosphocholine acyltransferase 1 n=1 Tax=Favolaschia claudopus TaxID=2862362 RepID=A0AAW0EA96_9AGAR
MSKDYFSGPFSGSFERFRREEMSDWTSAFTLLGTILNNAANTVETYFDSHVDLLQRKLQKHSDRLKMRAEETFKIRDLSGDALAENFEREFKSFRLRVSSRMTKLSSSWQSAKVVRTREKVSFFFGVMSLVSSALLFGLAPQWIHVSYTLQALYLLPLRVYFYKKRAWHCKWHFALICVYLRSVDFLFDLCYYVSILNLIYLWVLPFSPALFTACYCLSHGSLASAVITWRNSLVFHDIDKVTSLFIHIYAPFTFTVIRHFYPSAELRFPALLEVPHLNPIRAMLLSGGIYLSWQILYWKFILVDRRQKIESGQRTTSFSFLLNDKRGMIGRMLSSTPPAYREVSFMAGQLVYGVLTEAPAVYLLYDSPFWSGAFLILILSVSVWNGGGFYIEVFGRKFERELEALRKELAESNARSGLETPLGTPGVSSVPSEDGQSSAEDSPPIMIAKHTIHGEPPELELPETTAAVELQAKKNE